MHRKLMSRWLSSEEELSAAQQNTPQQPQWFKQSFIHTHTPASRSTSVNRIHLAGVCERRHTTHSCSLAQLHNIWISKDTIKWLNVAKVQSPPPLHDPHKLMRSIVFIMSSVFIGLCLSCVQTRVLLVQDQQTNLTQVGAPRPCRQPGSRHLRHCHVHLTCASLAGALPAVNDGGFQLLDLRRRPTGEGAAVSIVFQVGGRLTVDSAEGLDWMPGAAVVWADQRLVCQDSAVLCDDGAL